MENTTVQTVATLAEQLAEGTTTSLAICQNYLEQTAKHNPNLNAFLDIQEEAILQAAREADQRRNTGKALSKFDGIPIGIKDNISVKGERCSCASKILENFKACYDATVIERLKGQGMIPFGRLNMDEFAMGSTCQNSAFGGSKNPWNTDYVPGGSSGGSATAVSAQMVPIALGSDTGGSIRQPAAFCGITGFKPAYGTVSRYGLVAFASSLDQIGPMGNDVRDCAEIYNIISGRCTHDSTTIAEDFKVSALPKNADLKGTKIGIPKEYFTNEGMDPHIKAVNDETLKRLEALGAELVPVSIPTAGYSVAVYYILATAEASANLARFDGIRYGHRAQSKDLLALYGESRAEGFGAEVKRRIILGTYVLSSGYYDAYYLRAQKVRTLICNDFNRALAQCDALLAPVSPDLPLKIGERATIDPLKLYLADIFTGAVNLFGGCGISVPVGMAEGFPVGIQIIGAAQHTQNVFKIAAALQDHNNNKLYPTL